MKASNQDTRLCPTLRFHEGESDREWQIKKLGDLCDITTGKLDANAMSLDGQYRFYTCAKEYLMIDNYAFDTEALLISGNGANVGYIHYYQGKFNAYQRTYVLDGFTDAIKFIQYQLEVKLKKRIQLESKAGNIPYIVMDTLAGMRLSFPALPEQKKIADFLTSVDERIGQLIKKKALLEDYKKGVMQQLFSQQIRFKDDNGNDFPDWEEKKLGELATCLDNLRRPVNATEREKMKGDIPYYGANGIQGYVNDFIFDEDLTLLAEDGGNFDEFSNRPIAQRVTGKAWVNNHAHILRAKPLNMTPAFLFHSLVHKDIRKYINGSSRAKLNKGDMLTIAMIVPNVLEQKKIADFLSAIDQKIESVSQQIAKTQTFKKGLLQQMFV